MNTQPFLDFGTTWFEVSDGNDDARAFFDRHYSARKKERMSRLFMGPGEKLILVTPDLRALFAWRRCWFDFGGQTGAHCAIFRNEGAGRSSDLIRAAMERAWQKWPGERFFTHVNPRAVASPNPGYCFKAAGWKHVGRTKVHKYDILAYEAGR